MGHVQFSFYISSSLNLEELLLTSINFASVHVNLKMFRYLVTLFLYLYPSCLVVFLLFRFIVVLHFLFFLFNPSSLSF